MPNPTLTRHEGPTAGRSGVVKERGTKRENDAGQCATAAEGATEEQGTAAGAGAAKGEGPAAGTAVADGEDTAGAATAARKEGAAGADWAAGEKAVASGDVKPSLPVAAPSLSSTLGHVSRKRGRAWENTSPPKKLRFPTSTSTTTASAVIGTLPTAVRDANVGMGATGGAGVTAEEGTAAGGEGAVSGPAVTEGAVPTAGVATTVGKRDPSGTNSSAGERGIYFSDVKPSLPITVSPSSSPTLPDNVSRKRGRVREDTPPPKKLRTSTLATETRQTATPRKMKSRSVQSQEVIDVYLQRQLVEFRMHEAKEKALAAQTTPSQLGEQLYRAVAQAQLKEIRRLLDAGADVNYINKHGSTPLLRSLFDPSEDVVELLLQRGADANAVNEIGITAMHLVAGNNPSGRCMGQLIRAGGGVNARTGAGHTPLHTAADWNNETAVRALLCAGARRDLKPWDGPWAHRTPLDLTTSPEIRQLLRS